MNFKQRLSVCAAGTSLPTDEMEDFLRRVFNIKKVQPLKSPSGGYGLYFWVTDSSVTVAHLRKEGGFNQVVTTNPNCLSCYNTNLDIQVQYFPEDKQGVLFAY